MNSCRYLVRVRRQGVGGFEWKIYRDTDLVELHCSSQFFESRVAALLDSARVAAGMKITPLVEASPDRPTNDTLCSS